ncbi:peptidoglycan-binding protein [Rhizobium sp. Root274]|uniref:LysM peptidoglycan-binding domain-containing protein n=1 Tax=unclassified Rhizobium TaxID=2613769 RepID=UPI0007128E20|nr:MULTISPECIES: LysM peptidoglycan-binding domain-containing protein [unclassified Rhizobium]KQW31031.1 peptidoglycan-binding protein [Rhizobium sp. Root1240]KRD32579.1 peptidoglycan-binding protein [Rhizobium sp. Root274]
MKNRALWVVLFVLAIVTLLMVFVIMPRLNPTGDTAPAISATSDAVKSAADQAAASVDNATAGLADAAAEKMDRLKADAVKAVDGITALFADGRTPGVEAYSAAKTLAQGAVKALTSIEMPEGIDAKLTDAMKALQADAARALALIEQLPDDPAKAAGLIASIKDALLGKPADTAAAPAEAAGADVPRFDVLRVEPDGSTVIAGNAAPGAKVEILNDGTVISSQTVDGTGDFAAVLDNPLPPGDHALQIRATAADGKVVTSEEVATVSVPDGGKGELLAMVSKPGKASRLITLPGAADAAQATPAAAPAAAASTEVTPAAQPAAAAATAATPAVSMPELPAASSQLAGSAPTIPATGTDTASAPAAQPATDASTTPAAPATTGAAEVQVTAVEIEGDRIFVAGKAPVGAIVRGFADKATIGESKTDASGNFVIDGTMTLSVGSHIIEVEMLDASGKVVVRASVPFERPEGEQVSVVAQSADATAADAGHPELAEFERLRVSLTKALTILENLYANGQKPALEQLAAARSATEFGLQSIIGFRPGATATPEFVASVGVHGAKAKEALALLQSVKTGDVDGLGAALPKLVALIRDLLSEPTPSAAAVAPAAPATTPAPATQAPAAETAAADTAAAPKTIQQAPLAKSENSVIIRRGDTLWQISRRVYGQGVRYTTIYLANENQIRNPDLIEPGQIFTVPKDALPNAEEIHRKRLRGEPVN